MAIMAMKRLNIKWCWKQGFSNLRRGESAHYSRTGSSPLVVRPLCPEDQALARPAVLAAGDDLVPGPPGAIELLAVGQSVVVAGGGVPAVALAVADELE